MALRAAVVLLIAASGAAAQPTPAPAGRGTSPADGRHLYREYCSSCHGRWGKGDGPDAEIFTARPRNLREGFLNKYPTDDLVRRVREGKPLELALDLPALRARAAEVETVVGYLKRLPAVDWDLTGLGEELYLDRCAVCHGDAGRPGLTLPAGVRPPRDLSEPAYQRALTDQELIMLVRHGRHGMPALTPRVSEDEARALVAYVRLLSPGRAVYSSHCAACHGEDGRGAGSLAEEIRRPTVVFDKAYFARHDPEEVRAGVWHMVADEKPTMPHYATLLTDQQARAIVEYLKRTER